MMWCGRIDMRIAGGKDYYGPLSSARELGSAIVLNDLLRRKGDKSLYKTAYDYINSHGKDRNGQPLGQYFIHGLGHNIGLNVHDPGESCKPLVPGMVITIEPGIYMPEENLGVRLEDDVLVTETGHKVLSERLPRDPEAIERIMAEAAKQRSRSRLTGDD